MLARLSARRAPQLALMPKRFTSSVKEGSVAQSKGFKERESAIESEYAHKQEAAKLKLLKAQIEQKQLELEKLKQEHDLVAAEKK